MKIVFFGTDEFAKEILRFLLEQGLDIIAIVTREDKPRGRDQKLQGPPVKELCEEIEFKGEILQPVKASSEEFVARLKEFNAELFVVVSYGQILRQNVLDVPKYGTINVHPSLLPKFRGPSPIQSAVLAGEKETGVTIMEMELAMDAGGIIKVLPAEIGDEMTFGELETLLLNLAKNGLLDVIKEISLAKKIISYPQDEKISTYTKKIHSEDSFINWDSPAEQIIYFIRGMNPRPGARMFIEFEGKKQLMKVFKVMKTEYVGSKAGEMLYFDKERGLIIACQGGSVAVLEVQLEGKKRMDIKDFVNGFSCKIKFY
jgi:methionyl-tRNA formyltransferase